jgi:phosphoglycolate phosphatase-like HAD superfamily hydrolase
LLKKAVARARRLAHASFTAKDVYVIGDTPFDVSAGKKAGYKTVAVGTGYAEWKELVSSRPDHLVRNFRSVKKWLTLFELN